MADVVFGGTLGYMLRIKMLEPLPEFVRYSENLEQRDAKRRANEINARIVAERNLAQ